MTSKNRLLSGAVWLVLLGCLAVFVQAWHGLGWTSEARLDVAKNLRPFGSGWSLRLPPALRDPVVEHRGELFESGQPLARVGNRQDVSSLGMGRFVIRRGTLFFAADDGSDPRVNGHTYTLQSPRKIKRPWLIAAALVFSAVFLSLSRAGLTAWRWPKAGDSAFCLRLFFVVAAGRALWLFANMPWNDGFMMAQGMPFSDAMGWSEAAWQLSRGDGLRDTMGDQRPLYPVLLGLVYAISGVSLTWAMTLNALFGALAATAAGWLVRQVAGGLAGLLAGLICGLFGVQMSLLPLPMTETVGNAFIGLGLVFAARGLSGHRLTWFAAAGALFGLGNLSSAFTLLGAPLALLTAAAGVIHRGGFRRGSLCAVAGLAGFLLVLAPWVWRQKREFGILTFSPNSAELLYATVSPAGRLDESIFAEADAAGVPPDAGSRHRFFQKRFRESVAKDPAAFVRRLASGFVDFLDFFRPERPLFRTLAVAFPLLLSLAGAGRSRRAWQRLFAGWAVAGGACLLALLPGSMFVPLVLLGGWLSAGRNRRWLVATWIGLFLGAAAMETLTSGVVTVRVWAGIEWMVPACELIALARLHSWLSLGRTSPAGCHARDEPTPDRFFKPAALAVCVLVAGGLSVWGWRTVFPTTAAAADDSIDHQALKDQVVLAHRLDPRIGTSGRLWSALVCIEHYQCAIGAGENIHHWARPFAVRPDPRVVAYVRDPADSRLVNVQFGGKTEPFPDSTRAVVVGIVHTDENSLLKHGTEIIEVLGWFPIHHDPAGNATVAEQPELFLLTHEARAALAQAGSEPAR